MDFKKTLLAASLVMASASALAVPTIGGISFVGFGSPFAAGQDTTNATEFDFVAGPNAIATSATGDFVGLYDLQDTPFDLSFDTFTFSDFSFTPTLANTLVWSANSGAPLAFYLDSTNVEYGNSTLTVTGQGRIVDTVTLEEGIGYWSFSANEAGNSFSWSSSTEVPEPAPLALLGLGLAGLGLARRKAKKA